MRVSKSILLTVSVSAGFGLGFMTANMITRNAVRPMDVKCVAQNKGEQATTLVPTNNETGKKEVQNLPAEEGQEMHRKFVVAAIEQSKLFSKFVRNQRSYEALRMLNKQSLERQYSLYFKNANLSPVQKEQMLSLLTDNLLDGSEVFAIAVEQSPGADDKTLERIELELHERQTQSLQNGIRNLLGDAGLAQFNSYKANAREWASLDKLASRLSNANVGLSMDQVNRISNILISNNARITSDGAKAAIKAFLTEPQLRQYNLLLDEEDLLKEGAELDKQLKDVARNIISTSN